MDVQSKDKDGIYIGPRSTFRATGSFVAAAGTLPFLVIGGAAGRVIRIQKLRITNLSLTAAQALRIQLAKLSALPTGGTQTSPTTVPLDSQDAAVSGAVIRMYTVAPTAGTQLGNLVDRVLAGLATGFTGGGTQEEMLFNHIMDVEAPVLRSAAEGLCLLFQAAPASAVTVGFEIEWTEDGN